MNHHIQVLFNQTRLHEITRRAAMVTLLGVYGGSFRAVPPSVVPHVPGIHVILSRTGLKALAKHPSEKSWTSPGSPPRAPNLRGNGYA